MTASLDEVLAGVAREHRLEYGTDGRICRCGHVPPHADPELLLTQQDRHAAHLAAEQSRAVAEWLRSPEVLEAAARADALSHHGWTATVVYATDRRAAAAALDAVAGLCGGEES